jgi:DNA-binding NarL/FixJ family response regulator
VGRAGELGSLERVLDELDEGCPGAIEVAGEPGIGKTRLLRELAARAGARGHLVLSGAASEFENDLPFSVFVDALDEYVAGLAPGRLAVLDGAVQAELAHVFPSLSALAAGREVSPRHERYHSHRAVRELLKRLAAPAPLVLVLDDVQWADSASVELLGALLRRPPAAPVLMAVALRPCQTPERLSAALERAHRAAALTRIELGALTSVEAREFLGETVDAAGAIALYEESGGNPFYLEQLARSLGRAGTVTPVSGVSLAHAGVPPAWLARWAKSSPCCRRTHAVCSKVRRWPATRSSPSSRRPRLPRPRHQRCTRSINFCVSISFTRPTCPGASASGTRSSGARSMRPRPVAGGWAPTNAAPARSRRAARRPRRAHHVERSAREGDLGAVAILRQAGEQAARLAPASAARWFGAALRLLPETAASEERVTLLLARAGALTATGQFAGSHEALLEGLALVPEESIALRTTLTTACVGVEHRLGHYEQAHGRLVSELAGLPEPVSAEAVDLLIELALNEFYRSRYHSMQEWARRAVRAADVLADPPLTAAARAMPALACAMTGSGGPAHSCRAGVASLVDSLPDRELSRRLDAAAWLAAAELYLDRYAEADAHAARALALARATGQGELFLVLYQILGKAWYVRGKLDQATELLDGAIEAARLLGQTQALAGSLFNRSVVAVATGDLDTAVATAQESVDLARGLDEGFVRAWAAVRLAGVLLETGQPGSAAELLLSCAGGEEQALIPGSWRAYCLELLTRCRLALDHHAEAERAAACAQATAAAVRLPLAAAWADRAAAAVALHAGNPAHAAGRALAAAAAADQAGAPIEAALSRIAAGRALVPAGQAERAVAELQRAAALLDACGALRYRNEAERELGKLGHRIHRRTRPGKPGAAGIESLTERELQVARLVTDRKTNPQIAAELVLSQKTVETHLRNIFHKIDVSSRVGLARAIECADRTTVRPSGSDHGSPGGLAARST